MQKTWNELKQEVDLVTGAIKKELELNLPISLKDVLSISRKVAPDWNFLPNPNSEGQYCQIVCYPPNGFSCSFSISKYEIYN